MHQDSSALVGRRSLAGASRALALLVLAAPLLQGADPIFDAKGFDPEREFLSELPFEHVDPMTGNLLLTFTDLTLPGNAGFDLRVQRTYNSKIYENYTSGGWVGFREDSWAGIGWSLHFGRVSQFPTQPTAPGPVIEMPDGSQHQAYRHMDGAFGHYMTRDYWTYVDGNAPMLRLPNGIVYMFGRVLNGPRPNEVTHYVTQIRDPFGNTITVEYAAAPAPADVVSRVVQRIGTKTRTVTFTYDPTLSGVASGSLRSMTFEGRTWTYEQKRLPFLGYSALTAVQPPLGPAWRFEYSESSADRFSGWLLQRLTTPSGGQLDYTYGPQLFRLGSGVIYTPSLQTRTASGPGVAAGTWNYEYNSPDWRDPIQSSVTSPCGTTVRYTFKPIGSRGTEEPWAIGSMMSKEILQGSALLESQQITWIASQPISTFPESGSSFETHVPLVDTRTVTRTGSPTSYRTRYLYSPLAYNRSRASNFNDFGRAMQVTENGDLSRSTTRSFAYPSATDPSFGTYIVDRVGSETVQVGAELFTQTFDYVPATGFKREENRFGIVTRFEADSLGNVASSLDALNNQTRFTYDWGVLKDTITPEFSITREINSDGTVASETRRGLTTRFQYDTLSRPTLVDFPIGLDTTTEYDNTSGRFTRVRRGSSVVTTSLNGLGQVVRTENGLHVTTTRGYDACGRPVYEGYPFYSGGFGTPSADTGITTSYDALDRVLRRTHPDGAFQAFEHAGVDVTITDENSRRTVHDRSAFGSPDDDRLVALTDAEGKTTRYSYNALGALTRVEAPDGAPPRLWEYNARNELVTETQPENGRLVYTYDAAGNLKTRRDDQFGLTTLGYDRNNRLISVDRPGASYDTTVGWDASDNRTRATNGYVDSQFQYDEVNRLRRRIDTLGGRSFTTNYTYDDTTAGNGNLRTLGYPTGRSVVYDYDGESRVTSVKTGAKTLADTFRYHASGGVMSFKRGNGIVEDVEYDARYRPREIRSGSVLQLAYSYDGVGNVRSVDDSRTGMDLSITYDNVDRLLTASGPWGQNGFTYDAVGNRRSRTLGAASTTYTYDNPTQRLVSTTGADASSFAYDLNGNLRQDARGSYTHAPTNLMETATVAGAVSTYRYDSDELRKVRVTAGETHYYLHGPGGSLLSEVLDKGSLVEPVRDYVYAGTRLIAAIKPSPLVLAPTALSFTALAHGPATPAQTVRIETLGASGIAFTAVNSAPWLVSASGGSTPYRLSVSVNPSALAEGTYTGTIRITAPLAQGSPKDVTVSLTVVGQPELSVTPGSLAFEATAAQPIAALDSPPTGSTTPARAADALLRVPLSFERNQGQADPSIEFLARGPGYGLFLTHEAVVIGLASPKDAPPARVRMRFLDASPMPAMVAQDERPGRSRYYRGNDPSRWTADAPQFGRVAYEQLYPGIDAVFYGSQRQLEYDLVVAPGTSADRVRLAFEGADRLRLDVDGNLVLEVNGGELVQKKPVVYQGKGDARREIAGRYRLTGDSTVAFEVGEYDHSEPLVIDPVLSYFTYLGGSQGDPEACQRFGRCDGDTLYGVAVDASGSAYVAGVTFTTDFPVRGGGEGTSLAGGQDFVISKLDAIGASLLYSTYIGGSDDEFGALAALAPGGRLYVLGVTRSGDFPTTSDAVQSVFGGAYDQDPPGQDLVVIELGADGELLFSTYYGGRGDEGFGGIAVDAAGAAYVGGWTWSDNLTMRNSLQPAIRGSNDAFLAKFLPSGSATVSSLAWSTYFGGNGVDGGAGVALDAGGSVYLTGSTQSTDLPTVAPIQGAINNGAPVPVPPELPAYDAFVARFDATGTSLLFSTYLGGTGNDEASGLAIGPGNVMYVVGNTSSSDLPLKNPFQPYVSYTGSTPNDGFVIALGQASGLVYSSYAGTFPREPHVDGIGNLYFLYGSAIGTLDLRVNAFRSGRSGTGLAKVAADGSRYLFASPIGDGDGLGAGTFALDAIGNVFLVGGTSTAGLATAGAFKTTLGGLSDGFLLKLTGTGGSGGSGLLQQGLLIKDRVLAAGPDWTAVDNVPWLQLSQPSGTGPSIVFADVDTAGMLPGTYNGEITVTAPGAASSPKTVPVMLTIRPGNPQPAQANPGGPYHAQLLPEVELDGSASIDPAGTIASYLWTFDDSTTAVGARVKHVYATPGHHPVSLTIRGFSGATASAATEVYVNYPVEIRTTGPYFGVVGQPLLFDASQSIDPDGTVVAYQWTFGDGSSGSGPAFPHAYASPGTYTAYVSAQDNEGYFSLLALPVTITVPTNQPPVARPGGPYTGEPGVALAFDGSASSDVDGTVVAWSWNFGDGTTATGARPLRAFENAGTYDVTLTVTDNFGAQHTALTQATVGVFSVTPDHLTFRLFVGGSNPAPQSLALAFPQPHAFAAAEADPWLSIDATGGATPATLIVSVDATGLDAGTRQGAITITPAGVGARPIVVQVELVVEPLSGNCDTAAFFCEPFDELGLGGLAGQRGWQASPQATSSDIVVPDPRPGAAGNVLELDPVGSQSGEQVDFTPRPLDELEVSFEVMSDGASLGSSAARIDILGPPGSAGWGIEGRIIGSILVDSSLVLQNYQDWNETLVDTLDPQRWYAVRVAYRGGRLEVRVDGIPRFVGTPNGFASQIAGLAVTGYDAPGTASVDLIQVKPFVSPPLVGELVAEPSELTFNFTGLTALGRAEPRPASPTRLASAATLTAAAPPRNEPPRKELTLEFEPNVGQADPAVRFLARGRGYGLFVTSAETVLSLSARGAPVRLRFEGARSDAVVRGLDARPGKSHYLVGRDPAGWHRNVPRYAKVEMDQLYPGVNAVFYGNEGRVEYDLVVSPGADPTALKLRFDGVDSLRLDSNGDLVLAAAGGELRHRKPVVYQLVDGERRFVDASYTLLDRTSVGFRLGSFDDTLALTIDPTLVYSSFLGGTEDDAAQAVAIDLEGYVYVGGSTSSAFFPSSPGSYQPFPSGGVDAFVTKLERDGSGIVYSTYIGGLGQDVVEALAVDPQGGVFVGGRTQSTDFPLLDAWQPLHGGGGEDGFLLRLDPSGASLSFSTYLGGWLADSVFDLAMAPDGRVAVTGTASYGFRFTTSTFWVGYDYIAGFAARFAANGVPSFVAGIGEKGGQSNPGGPSTGGAGVAVDDANNTWITGNTRTKGLATPDAFQPSLGLDSDAFVAKFTPQGELSYFTYLGGVRTDAARDIAVDASGVTVTGLTASPDFPVKNPARTFHGGGPSGFYDGFVTKLQPIGTDLSFSTFLGEPYMAWGESIAADPSGSIHVGGRSDFTQNPDENVQAYLATLSADGSAIASSTTLGGSGYDAVTGLALDTFGDLWAVGQTSSPDFPTSGSAYQTLLGGGFDAFLLRYSNGAAPNPAGVLQLATGYGTDEHAGAATITVGRVGGESGNVTVEFSTGPGSALTPWDYTPVSGILDFAAGVTTKSFTVPVFHNQIHLGDRDFSVSLANPTGGAVLGRSTAPVTIHEADPKPTGLTATFRIRDRSLASGPGWQAFVNVPWITLNAYSGTGPSVVTVSASPTGMSSGTYEGFIFVTANATGSPVVIRVTLQISCAEGC